MALRGLYDTLEDVPEPIREHVKQVDGKYTLEVDGFVPRNQLNDFRTSNLKLTKQTEDLTAKLTEVETRYAGVDPDEYKALKAAPTDVQKQISEVETRLQKKYDEQFQAERKKTQEAETKFHHALIANEVALAAPKVGVHETALEDLQARAAGVFRVTEGKVVPFRGDDPLYSDKEPSKFLSMEEWLGGLSKSYPHYFKSSTGGGANGGLGGRSQQGRPVIAGSDQRSFINNLADIASGKIEVDLNA